MLKPILQNKIFNDGTATTTISIAGNEVDREQLHRMKAQIVDELARERDPQKMETLALTLAQINNSISLFHAIDEAKLEAEPLRQKIREEELYAADQGRRVFEGYCEEITRPAIERLTGVRWSLGMGQEGSARYSVIFDNYFAKLKIHLRYGDAEKQALEIRSAEASGREWKDIVKLPKPQGVPDAPFTVVIRSKPTQLRSQQRVHFT